MKKDRKTSILYMLTAVVFVIMALGPIVWSFVISISPETEMFKNTSSFLPSEFVFDNYRSLLDPADRQSRNFRLGIYNSLKACGLTVLIGIPTAVFSAYALSRMKFRGRTVIRNSLLVTMVIPLFTTIIPLYRIFSEFGFLDNVFWLTVVYVSSLLPITTWIISTYFDTIPVELEEAARIDGCGRIKTLFLIVIPVSYTIIFATVLVIFLMTWNQFQIPLILASSRATKPLSIVVSEFTTKDTIHYGITAAAGMLAIIPPAVLAVVFRKFLVKGLTGGSVKG